MKVLLLSHTCQSRSEGQPRARELARLGIELLVVVPRRWKEYGVWRAPHLPDFEARKTRPDSKSEFGVEVESDGCVFGMLPVTAKLAWCGPAQSFLQFYPGLGRVLREWQPDVIDIWEEPWSFLSLQTCWLRDRVCPGVPIVSETEQNINKTLPPPFETFRSQVLKKADLVVGRSLEATEIVRRKGYQGPTRVVPNAVDGRRFQPLSAGERTEVRAALGWAPHDQICGYIGRLVEEKGIADLVDALTQCPPQTRLALVGNGPFEASLRAQIVALGLESRVELLPARAQSELAPLMAALDVLVLPSRTTPTWKEQFGRVIIEAQACGVPVVGSDSGAIPDVVGEAGLVFPESDATQLAARLQWLADHPAEAAQIGALGRSIVEQKYTWERVAQAMAAIYEEVRA